MLEDTLHVLVHGGKDWVAVFAGRVEERLPTSGGIIEPPGKPAERHILVNSH